MQIYLYHLQNSRSQRIVWLCEELKLDYELITFSEHIKDQHKSTHPHPLKKFPTLSFRQDTTKEFSIIAESTAIVDLLCHLKK